MPRDPKLDAKAVMLAAALQHEVVLILVRPAEISDVTTRYEIAVGASTGDAPVWSMAAHGAVSNASEIWAQQSCRCPDCEGERDRLAVMNETFQARSDMAKAEGVH